MDPALEQIAEVAVAVEFAASAEDIARSVHAHPTLAEIVRAYTPNRMDRAERWRIYGSRWWEFLSGAPREANSEGGVFPAIFGTLALTTMMSFLVMPFGVLAALFGVLMSLVSAFTGSGG